MKLSKKALIKLISTVASIFFWVLVWAIASLKVGNEFLLPDPILTAKRLFELADSISEIKTICVCGRKATVNARLDGDGNVLTEGTQLFLGGNESYTALCHRCSKKRINDREKS